MNQFEHFFNNVEKKHLIHKWVHYFEIYEKHFNKFKGKCPTILEIGVARGGSLDMWNYYFENNCNIIGIDIDPYCKQFEKDNIQIFIGDQGDDTFWDNFNKNGIYFDIIIDDGGHFMHQQIITFEKMYPMVKHHGVYLCEDTHTSYWKEWNNGSITFMDYSKNFVDNLNYFHQIPKGKCFDTFCVSFYDSVVVLDKRLNQQVPYDQVKVPLKEFVPLKIVDCFIFYNEIDLLSYRLNLLKDVVDYFIIVEATKTFTGKPKEMYFKEHLKEKYNCIYIVVDDLPFLEPSKDQVWSNEKFQRNCISRGLEQLNLNDNDILIFSDVDEIPDPTTLKLIKTFNFDNIYSLEQDLYYYNIELKLSINWYHAKITTYNLYKLSGLSIDDIRWTQFNFIKKGGWHLSYFGNTDFIKNKIQNFSHQEYNNLEILNTIDSKVNNGLDLFGRYQIQKIPIHLNEYLPPNFKLFGFHSDGHLTERGTAVAMYDYAYHIKKDLSKLKKVVIIFYDKNNKLNNNDVIKKFKKEFDCYAYDSFEEVKQFNLEYFYNITGVNDSRFIIKGVKNLTHVVFKTQYSDENETVAVISPCVSSIFPVVPHMINLPNHNFNMRKDLGIPENATVFGRYGGYNEFNIEYVQSAIKETLNIYFLFANTKPFTESFHPNIIYLDTIVDLDEKVKFINTCDAMIHARLEGETFGLSIAEFSSKNKPILTTYGTDDNAHINLLGKSAIIYNEHNLKSIFKSEIKPIESAYSEYTPEKVMDQFYTIFHLKNER